MNGKPRHHRLRTPENCGGGTLIEWLVVMALSIVMAWGSLEIFALTQVDQQVEEAKRELRDCALEIEKSAWDSGTYASVQLSVPPCVSSTALIQWFWEIPDGGHFTLWRIAQSAQDSTSDSTCRGWAIDQDIAIWRVDGSGRTCSF